jgi:hypothetical protein
MKFTKMNFLIISLTMGLFVPIAAFSTLDNQTKIGSLEDTIENNSLVTENNNNFTDAKFSVKTQLSDECLSHPVCKNIKERYIQEDVFIFYPNIYIKVVEFPGSNNPRNLVFDEEYYFKNSYALQVEAIVDESSTMPINSISVEYDSCSVYLKAGQEANCIIIIKPSAKK